MIDENGKSIYSIKKVPTNMDKIKKALRYNQIISHPTDVYKRQISNSPSGNGPNDRVMLDREPISLTRIRYLFPDCTTCSKLL